MESNIYKKYKLYRINLKNHPIIKEDYHTKLYYFTILYTTLKQDNILNCYIKNLLDSYKKVFGIKEEDYNKIEKFNIERNKDALNKMFKVLRKTHYKLTKWRIYTKNYKYLLICELMYLESRLDIYEYINKSYIKDVARDLKINKKDLNYVLEFFEKLSENNFEEANEIISKSKFVLLNYFLKKYKDDFEFEKKEEKNILVIATMSSGKSTLINAILGQDILPSQNEICTSKIITVTQNYSLDRCIGFAKGNKEILHSYLNNKILNDWNISPEYKEIEIEGGLSNIGKYKKKLKFIDTPGTNNSIDKNHYKLTYGTLNKNKFDLIIYVLNATNLACDDDYILLNTVAEYLKKNSKQDILFVLNKMDEIDIESNESLQEIYDNAMNYIKKAGINEPKLISISAYGAKLFRKVLNGDSLTRKESIDFLELYEMFLDEQYNMNNYTNVKVNAMNNLIENREENFVEIRKEKISLKTISNILKNTGLLQLESYLISD
ncbi:GTPase Era [Clostridium tepidiprofundi DSM 19306]|uniref:GTPase Era n=1 Tax=Clostridium tepidiprofundi DSM 19306 TaxID=1121338 RepID=A0A151AUW0_9CLOT|nr:dynamin family protein [Clostridium tepidiprofundi]KYH31391.1 GTPase Era [Clostridium tepidiprofundi DSM 19306]